DYFNNSFGPPHGAVQGVTGLAISVLDFVTAAPGFPSAGVSNANLAVDASGNTPDLSGAGLLAVIAPFTFPSGSIETTSGQYTVHGVTVSADLLGDHVHGWLQFPPGDDCADLQCGGDSSSGNNGCSFFSQDCYATPAVSFFVNWGIRLQTN